jgi:membrane protease YdiL (CAAX protease family)
MTFSASLLTILSVKEVWTMRHFHTPDLLKDILLGAAIAMALWCVFWVGDKASTWLFDFARPQVNLIYGMKEGESPWLLSCLLLFLIGPAEEIFWRGYVQEKLSRRYSPNMGFILTTACYTLVHVASFNFMLVMASMVCGVAWGLLYRLFPNRFLAIILSHALWDAAVFVWFPI